MTSIQGLLIAGCIAAAVFGSTVFRTRLAHRLVVAVLCSVAIVFVLFPDLTTVVAKRLGVGRGTDLLFYVSLIAGVNVVLHLYRRTRELERKITKQVRAAALHEAQYMGRQ